MCPPTLSKERLESVHDLSLSRKTRVLRSVAPFGSLEKTGGFPTPELCETFDSYVVFFKPGSPRRRASTCTPFWTRPTKRRSFSNAPGCTRFRTAVPNEAPRSNHSASSVRPHLRRQIRRSSPHRPKPLSNPREVVALWALLHRARPLPKAPRQQLTQVVSIF